MEKRKRNKVLLFTKELEYYGKWDYSEYESVIDFLEYLHNEGLIDEVEKDAYDNIKYKGKCTDEEYEYVLESIELWSEYEYFRRLNEVNTYNN